jgi:hypothetical protein
LIKGGNAMATINPTGEIHSGEKNKLLKILGVGFGLAVVIGGNSRRSSSVSSNSCGSIDIEKCLAQYKSHAGTH